MGKMSDAYDRAVFVASQVGSDDPENALPGITVEDIVAILRANPRAAWEAVREAKIAGPWEEVPGRRMVCRYAAHGLRVAEIEEEPTRDGWWQTRAYASRLRTTIERQDGRHRMGGYVPEHVQEHRDRLDALLIAAGWILVDLE